MFVYKPNFVPNKFVIIGVGGTGSRLVPMVAQFIKSCPWILNPEIHLVDFDMVEEKNLARQLFIAQDVGKYKATVLAQRYGKAFNLPIIPHTHALEARSRSTPLDNIIDNYPTNIMYFVCVDSVAARRNIYNRVSSYANSGSTQLLIDGGNENDFGQIHITSLTTLAGWYEPSDYPFPNIPPDEVDIGCLPIDDDYFSGMVENKAPSCADLDQTMAINIQVATSMFSVLQNFVYAKPLNFHRLNISLSHGCTPEYLTTAYLKRCARMGGMGPASESIARAMLTYHAKVWKPMHIRMKKEEEARLFKEAEDARLAKIAEAEKALAANVVEEPIHMKEEAPSELPPKKVKRVQKKSSMEMAYDFEDKTREEIASILRADVSTASVLPPSPTAIFSSVR